MTLFVAKCLLGRGGKTEVIQNTTGSQTASRQWCNNRGVVLWVVVVDGIDSSLENELDVDTHVSPHPRLLLKVDIKKRTPSFDFRSFLTPKTAYHTMRSGTSQNIINITVINVAVLVVVGAETDFFATEVELGVE